jgi:hypothetical protein
MFLDLRIWIIYFLLHGLQLGCYVIGAFFIALIGWLLDTAKMFFSLEVTVRIKPMMMKLPYAQQSGIEVSDTETWNTFNINVSKGY